MECEALRLKRVDCDALLKIFSLPCQAITGGEVWLDKVSYLEANYGKYVCKARDIAAGFHERNGTLHVQNYWPTKTQYIYFQVHLWETYSPAPNVFRKRTEGQWGYRCYYMGKEPFDFTKFISPEDFIKFFKDTVATPLRSDGLPNVPNAEFVKMMSKDALLHAFSDTELNTISAQKRYFKHLSMKYTVCIEKYENLGRGVIDTQTGIKGELLDIRYWDVPELPFTYKIKFKDGKIYSLYKDRFQYTD